MADSTNPRRYENLNRLSIEELEELLRTAPFITDSQETSEYYDAIEEVLLQKETKTPTGRLSDIDSAWLEFRQQYASPEGRGQRLYPDDEDGGKERSAMKPERKVVFYSHIFRKAGLVAAAVAVLFACMIAAQASGLDVFGALAHWTDETFQFNHSETAPVLETAQTRSENESYHDIQAEVDRLGITVPVVPTWFPEEYTLQEFKTSSPDITEWKSISCTFTNDKGEILHFVVFKYAEGCDISTGVYEKDDQPVVEYIKNGKRFYIMSDHQYKTAVWNDGSMEIMISGPVTEKTVKAIIDSIGGS